MKRRPQIEPDRHPYTAICVTQMIKSRQNQVAFIKTKRATYGKFVQQRKLGESGLKHTARKRVQDKNRNMFLHELQKQFMSHAQSDPQLSNFFKTSNFQHHSKPLL